MNKNVIPVICFLFCILFYSASLGFDTDCESLYTFRGGQSCQEFKEKALPEKSLHVTFTEKPQVSGEDKYWVLNWNGINVLLPQISYEHVYISKDANKQYGLFLITSDSVRISLFVSENGASKDVFAVVGFKDNELETTPEGIAATKAMYGGSVRISDLLMLAYETTPEQITCCKDKYDEEIGKLVALILKDIAQTDLIAVYRGVGRYDGWITKSKTLGHIEYVLNIVPESRPDQILQITYQIPDDEPFHNVPFLIGTERNTKTIEQSTIWVRALNSALKYDSMDSWQKYLLAADEDGISEKSISKVRENLKLEMKP